MNIYCQSINFNDYLVVNFHIMYMGGHVSHIKYHSIYQIYNNHYLLATPTINTNWNLTTTKKKLKLHFCHPFLYKFLLLLGLDWKYCELWMSFINIIARILSFFSHELNNNIFHSTVGQCIFH